MLWEEEFVGLVLLNKNLIVIMFTDSGWGMT